jgi:hypothetical protein
VAPPHQVFTDYFRCPGPLARLAEAAPLPAGPGYFLFGGTICYGRAAGVRPGAEARGELPDLSGVFPWTADGLRLPFELAEVVTNLREERYTQPSHHLFERLTRPDAVHKLYYLLRPLLAVGVRRHLQKIRLAGWRRISFPTWPVDVTVEVLMRHCMALLLQGTGVGRIPFIWFWPEGRRACLMLTHDVEGPAGMEFCGRLTELDESYGLRSAFQLIPEMRNRNVRRLASELRARGFEVNVHDMNHDGYLFRERDRFLERAARINGYISEFGCRGFRAGAMYRRQSWFDAFAFSYDMSVPNVAHLEPQRGGCCTVMPYFVGRILELPLTTLQDYSLFHVLNQYSIALWKGQVDRIMAQNGLISVLAHPDYLVERRARETYVELLKHLAELRDEQDVWSALPGEVDHWWRCRDKMALVPDGDGWRVKGPESERARVAYATLQGGRVVYTIAGGSRSVM